MNLKHSAGISLKLARYLLLCFLPLILIGCGKTESEGERTLRIGGLGGKPGPINQIITNSTISVNLADLVFGALVRINEQMMPEPDLAERWQVSPDGLTYTFYLRQSVKFHDGTGFTAQDCEFTYNAVLDPANKSPWRENYTMIKDIKAQDRYTFTVTLREAQASFINLMNFPIHHHTKGLDVGANPVGTGPFRFVERTADDTIILERNQDYYDPHTKGIGVGVNRIEARGYDTFSEYFSAFMNGRIDMIQFLNTEQYETLARDPAFRAYSFPSIYTYMIDYNPAHPLFSDQRVRQALAHAINIPEIINKVEWLSLSPEGRGQGEGEKGRVRGEGNVYQSTGPFIPGAWFSNPEVKPLEYNPALSLKLLNESGWELNDNGILERAGYNPAQEFRFTLLVDPKERVTETIAKIIYQDLYKVGVRCEIKPCDYGRLDEAPNKELINKAGAAIISIRMIQDDLEPSWHSSKHSRAGKLWPYVDPEIDALFEQANATQDINQRKELYHRLHQLVYAEQSGTFLYVHPNLCAISNRFGNTDRFFSPAMPFYTIKDWIKE